MTQNRSNILTLAINKIRLDLGTQTRESIDEPTRDDYAEKKRNGVTFPPPIVVFDGTTYVLVDGFHRVLAEVLNGSTEIEVELRLGTLTDAFIFALGANASNGLQRSSADKRKAIRMALDRFSDWTDRRIAETIGVSPKTVLAVRSECVEDIPQHDRRVGADGRSFKATKPKPEGDPLSEADKERRTELEATIDASMSVVRESWDKIHEIASTTGRDHRDVFEEFRPDGTTRKDWGEHWQILHTCFDDADEDDSLLPANADLMNSAYLAGGDWGRVELLPSTDHPGYVHVSYVDTRDDGDNLGCTKRPIIVTSAGSAIRALVPGRMQQHLNGSAWTEIGSPVYDRSLRAMADWSNEQLEEATAEFLAAEGATSGGAA